MITDILDILTEGEKNELTLQLAAHKTQPYQLISFTLKGITDKGQMIKKMGISESSYFKNVTLARDILYGLIKAAKSNQYDEIILIRRLYLRGLEQRALELYHKLEKDYEAEQLWGALDVLHHEAIRIYYTKCDLKNLKLVSNKAALNIERYAVYARLDKQLLYEMALLEKSEMSLKEAVVFEKRVIGLLEQAKSLSHHVLMFNALRCCLELYSKFNISISKAESIVAEMDKLAGNGTGKMNAYTRMILYLNVVSFLTTFNTKNTPEKYTGILFPVSGAYAQIDVQVIFNYLYYYCMTGSLQQFKVRYNELISYKTEKDVSYLKHTATCLWCYMQNDFKGFAACRNQFYQAYDNRAYLEYDLMIRYMELLVMLKEQDLRVWADRVEALEKFARRNFTAARYGVEKDIIKALKNKAAGKALKQAPRIYRFHKWMDEQLVSIK